MRKFLRYLIITLLVLVTLNLLFIWSHSTATGSQSTVESTGFLSRLIAFFHIKLTWQQFYEFEHYLRKCAHFAEFSCLGALSIALTFCICRFDAHRTREIAFLPAECCLLAASTDEMIQIFFDRGNSVSDIFLDFCGSLFGIALFLIIVHVVIKHRGRRDRMRASAHSDASPVTEIEGETESAGENLQK